MPLAWSLVLLPWAGAVLLALWPPRGALPALLNLGVSAGTCALALLLLWEPQAVQGWLRTDALNLPLVAVAGIIGLTTAAVSAATERFEGLPARAYHAGFQIVLGAQFLALLADDLGVLWVALAMATLAAVAMRARQAFWLSGIGLLLALFGTILLYAAVQPAIGGGGLSWDALRAVAGRGDPAILSLALVFLLVGYGTMAALVPLQAQGTLPVGAVLSDLLLNAAMLALLRGAAIVGAHPQALAPSPLLVGFGLASLLLAAFALWRRGDAQRLLAWSSIGHLGLASIAFGLGAGAVGVLQLVAHALVRSAVSYAVGTATLLNGSQAIRRLAVSHPALGWGLALGLAGLAGMPPFAIFVVQVRVVAEAAARQPWLLVPLGLGLFVMAAALIRALHRLCLGRAQTTARPTHPDTLPPVDREGEDGRGSRAFTLPGGLLWATIPVWLLLVLAAVLPFALPAALP